MHIWTLGSRIWVENLRRDPGVGFSVQEEPFPRRAVVIKGRAEVVTGDDPEFDEEILRITRRYVDVSDEEAYIRQNRALRTIVRISADSGALPARPRSREVRTLSPRARIGDRSAGGFPRIKGTTETMPYRTRRHSRESLPRTSSLSPVENPRRARHRDTPPPERSAARWPAAVEPRSPGMPPLIFFSRRVRETPFERRVLERGAKAFTVYNQMTLASVFRSLEEDYWHLREHVQLWDVACERQVEVRGPDALRLVELATPRDISACRIGQCVYAPLCDEAGGIVNDPLVLRLDEDRLWVSIADSGVLLWLKGLAVGRGFDVEVFEPDVNICALQGPKADVVLQPLVDADLRGIRFFRFIETRIAGAPVVVARSGWSGQGGFEIYLQDSTRGLDLWDAIQESGEAHRIRAGCPNLIERIETGLLSYGTDMTLANNIFECGLDRFVKLGKEAEHLSRRALDRIAQEGVAAKLAKMEIEGGPAPALRSTWPVLADGCDAGYVTSAAWSPRFETVVAFAMVKVEHAGEGERLLVRIEGEWSPRPAKVVEGWKR